MLDADVFTVVWLYFVHYVVPFGAFFFGVTLDRTLNVSHSLTARQHYYMAVPVALIMVATILYAALESYQSHILKYFIINGLIIIQGTVVMDSFARFVSTAKRRKAGGGV